MTYFGDLILMVSLIYGFFSTLGIAYINSSKINRVIVIGIHLACLAFSITLIASTITLWILEGRLSVPLTFVSVIIAFLWLFSLIYNCIYKPREYYPLVSLYGSFSGERVT